MVFPWIPGASALDWGPMSEVEEFRYSVGHEGYLRGLSQYGSDQSDAGDNEDGEEQRAGRELEEKQQMKTMDRAGGETEDHTLAGERAKREPMPVADCDYEPDDRSWKGIPCMVCKTQLNGPRQYEQHLSGKYHAERVKAEKRRQECLDHANSLVHSDDDKCTSSGEKQQRAGREPTPVADPQEGKGEKTHDPTMLWYESGPAAPASGGLAPASSLGSCAGREPTPPPPDADGCLMPTAPYPRFLGDEPIPCHICKIPMNGPRQYKEHIMGKKHRQNLRRRLLPGPNDPNGPLPPIVTARIVISGPDESGDALRAYTHVEIP